MHSLTDMQTGRYLILPRSSSRSDAVVLGFLVEATTSPSPSMSGTMPFLNGSHMVSNSLPITWGSLYFVPYGSDWNFVVDGQAWRVALGH